MQLRNEMTLTCIFHSGFVLVVGMRVVLLLPTFVKYGCKDSEISQIIRTFALYFISIYRFLKMETDRPDFVR
jgi:hypothetical protein